MPAALSFASSSLLESPCSLAISCTRFLVTVLHRFYEFGPGGHTRAKGTREAPAAARGLQAGWVGASRTEACAQVGTAPGKTLARVGDGQQAAVVVAQREPDELALGRALPAA